MNALDQLKEMLQKDRKTLPIKDIAPLVYEIERMYINTSVKLSQHVRANKDMDIKLRQAQASVVKLSARIAYLHMSPEEQAEAKKPGKQRRKKKKQIGKVFLT